MSNLIYFYICLSSVAQLSLRLSLRLFATPWTAACQASLPITNSQSLPKLMSIETVMPSNHLILCHPLLLLISIFTSAGVFSNELALPIRWPKYWSFSFSISPPVNIQGWFPLGLTCLISLLSKGLSRVLSCLYRSENRVILRVILMIIIITPVFIAFLKYA